MEFSRTCLFLLILTSTVSVAQTHRYMVFFADKSGTPHTISQPSTFLSQRSIQRRSKVGAATLEEDLPVVPGYVTQVRATGAKAFFTTRWMNGVLVEANSSQLTSIQGLPFVSSTELVAPNAQLLGGRKAAEEMVSTASAASDAQLTMLGLDSMQHDGYRGSGIWIAVLDSGFPGVESVTAFQELRDDGRIIQTTDFIRNSDNVYQYDAHGTTVLSVMAAKTSMFQGGAPEAGYLLYVTEDAANEYRVEEYNWLFAAERADSAGVDIIQSSLGYTTFDDPSMDYTTAMLDGVSTVVSRAASRARDRGIVVVVSAGNLGGDDWQFVAPPADVDGVLSVGAVTITGVKATFSSIGPSADGRVKPDVVALGAGVSAIDASGQSVLTSGTSLAAPLVSSLVAGLLEAYPGKTPAELVAAIKASASKAASPDNFVGFGIPKYQAVRNYLSDQPVADDVVVYPNPVVGDLLILFRQIPEGSVSTILYDVTGKVIEAADHPITWDINPMIVSTDQLSPGTYMLRIQTSTFLRTVRFVKL